MTDANQDHQGIAVERGDVEVEKEVDAEGFGVPSLVITVRARTDDRVTVRIRDPLPDEVDGGDIGFHPNHGGEFWTYDGDAVVFERGFEPGETYTTVYGVADADPSTDGWLLAEPSVEVENEARPADDEETVADIAVVEPEGPEETGERDLDQLRRDVDSLTATVESMEARLGSGDTAGHDADAVGADVESIGERLADLEAEVDSSRVRTSSVSAEVEEIRDAVESIREETDDLAADLRETSDGVRRNSRDIDDVGAEVAELATTVDTLAAEMHRDDRIASLEDDVAAMREDVENILAFQERLAASLGDVESS